MENSSVAKFNETASWDHPTQKLHYCMLQILGQHSNFNVFDHNVALQ